MRAISQIREVCKSGRTLNDAMRYYTDRNPHVTPVVKTEPILFGQLALHYLEWTADILATLEKASEARPSSLAAVGFCRQRVTAYFERSSRWPPVDYLDGPLRLLMPAYYAVRAVKLANFSIEPPLLRLSDNEARGVLIEILGPRACETVDGHKNVDLRTIPRVADPAGRYQTLTIRSFPSARERALLVEARSKPPTGPGVDPVAPDPPAPAPVPATVVWTQRLSDSRIMLEATNSFDSDYSGGSTYCSRESFLDLFGDGRYRLVEVSITQISSGGFSLGGPSRSEARGAWEVESTGGGVHLRLTDDVAGTMDYRIASGVSGLVLDGRPRPWTRL